jgi:hypothetical protein
MNTQPILTTIKPVAKARNLLFIALLAAAIGYYLLLGSQEQGMVRAFGWVFMMCSLACIYGIFKLNSLTIYDDRIEMKYLIGSRIKIILRKDITQWQEREMKGNSANTRMTARLSYQLTLHTASEKLSFSSLNYDNYDQIKLELTKANANVG